MVQAAASHEEGVLRRSSGSSEEGKDMSRRMMEQTRFVGGGMCQVTAASMRAAWTSKGSKSGRASCGGQREKDERSADGESTGK